MIASPNKRTLPLLMLVAAAVVYGAIFSFHKMAAEAGVPPIAYAFWQSLIAGLVLLVASAAGRAPPGLSASHIRAYLVIGALVLAAPITLLTYTAPHLPAGLLTLVLALSPPFTYLIGMLVRIERFAWLGVLGIVFGFSGVLMIVAPAAALPTSEMAAWFLLALVAPVFFASSNVSAAVLRPPAMSSAAMGAGVLLGAAAILAVLMAATGQTYWFAGFPGPGDWAILGAAAVNCIFFVLFLEIVRLAGPVFFAQFNYLAVLAGIGWGWLLFDERLSLYVWLALVLMFAGVFFTTMKDTFVRPGSRGAAP